MSARRDQLFKLPVNRDQLVDTARRDQLLNSPGNRDHLVDTARRGQLLNSPGNRDQLLDTIPQSVHQMLPPVVEPFQNIPDPCLQPGLILPAKDISVDGKIVTFSGTGDYHKCQEAVLPLLNLSQPCSTAPCSMNGIHQPKISFSNSEFYGFAELWYTMEDVYRIGGQYEHDVFDAMATVSAIFSLFVSKKRQAIVIASLLLLLSCRNFNVAHYSKSFKGINTKLEYLLIMTRCSCKTRDITLKAIVLELCPFLT